MNSTIIWTVVVLACLGLVLSLVLYFVAKKFKVEEDPRIDDVEKAMPGANCGGCGYAGCRAFAEAAVKAPNLDNNFCPVGGNEVMKKVAAILGYEVKEKTPQVAVVRCNGTCSNRPVTNVYDGVKSCKVKAALYCGDTACSYGCLGCGDCVTACQFGAITMNLETGLPIVDESKCTACGACAKACPKSIIELRDKGPRGMREYVSCINADKGPVARKACSAACIGCGLCAKTCTHGAVTVENNIAYIDYSKCKLCRECEAVCPTGAIHGVNFPKPLDVEGIKARIAKRKAAEAGTACAASGPEKKVNGPSSAQAAPATAAAVNAAPGLEKKVNGPLSAQAAPATAAAVNAAPGLEKKVNGPLSAQAAPATAAAVNAASGPEKKVNGPSSAQTAPVAAAQKAAVTTDKKEEQK